MSSILSSHLIQAGMTQIDKVGWANFHPFQLILNGTVYHSLPFTTREEFLNQCFYTLNNQVIQETQTLDLHMPLRERLFEVLMTRFDVLNPYKTSLKHIWDQRHCSTGGLLINMPEWLNGFHQLLAHAFIDKKIISQIKSTAFLFFYLQAQQAWFQDDSFDLTATMAATDQAVQRYLEIFY